MAKETKYSIKDFKKDFPTDEACLELIFNSLHSKECSCGGEYKKIANRKQYQCSKCRYQIAPTSGTIFHKSSTPLSLWFHAIWVFSNAKSGISSKEMERQLGVTYKCAWRILSQIRKALAQEGDKLSGDVEVDTGFFGGKGKMRDGKMSEAVKNKSVVNVAIERGNRAKAKHVSRATAEAMTDFIYKNIDPDHTTLMTDKSSVYYRADKKYGRVFVNHKKEYVRGDIHVNSVETFFAHLKRSIKGTHKVVSKQHLQSYLNSFVFHYNNRGNDRKRFQTLVDILLHA